MAAKNKEIKTSDFRYCDAWHSEEDGTPSNWQRIELSALSQYQQDIAGNFNCFASVQRFANKDKTKGEPFIAPLYFDLDSDDPAKSQADAVKVIDFFTKELDIKPSDMWVYFSGSKGFHILVSSTALAIEPNNLLCKVFKHIAGYLIHRLELSTLDLVVYTVPRMLRLPNSVHQKTRLFKIELTIDEIKTLSIQDIQTLAKQPRKDVAFTRDIRKAEAGYRPKGAHFFADKKREYEQAAATSSERYRKDVYQFDKDKPPACVQDILEHGWKKEGDRNNATVQLSCYFKDAGHTKDEALTILEEWVTKHTSAKSKYQIKQRVANTRSVVDAVYNKDNEYRFGCAFIRSLHGIKRPGEKDYDRVACAGDLCPCVGTVVSDDEAISLHLSETGKAELTGKLVKTKVMVAGKKQTPYIVPRKVEYSCWGYNSCKKVSCPLIDIPTHTSYKNLGHADRELIQMTATGDDNIKGILREMSSIPSCAKYDTNIVETCNVEELLVIPMAETSAEDDEKAGRYVLRRVYAVGGLQVAENKYYEITGYVHPHPKNQEGTILIRNAKPLQDVVEAFKLTDEVQESLKVFQPTEYTPEDIERKLAAICADLTYNQTYIVERDETLLGVLLTQHSVLRFKVPWDTQPIRGWLEMLIIGDTGTGKSHLIERLMKFCGLGSRVNAESTSRTGLTYKMEQSGAGGAWYIVWGAWPLADKEMIWIDECTGIDKEQYGEMTLARSDGKLEVKRAVTAETPCRVRAILSGNVPKGKRLADYAQGVACLKDIFNNEDIRRFDFGVFMRAADVNPDLYNQQLPIFPQMITAEAYKNNILFAWSKTPDDVIFSDETIGKILAVATDISKIYGNANDVPLVSPSDQRNKVARLAVALAALTHSVDEHGTKLIVYPGHVDFIGAYLKDIYNAPGCGLNYYAKLAIKEEELTDERYEKLTAEIKKLDTLKGDNKFFEFIRLFAQQSYLRLGDVEAMLSVDKEEAKAIVNMLTKMRMIINTSGGFRKTPKFNSYVAKCFEFGIFDTMDEEY